MHVGLHDGRAEGPADAPPALQQAGQEAPGPQFRERELKAAAPAWSRSSPGDRCARRCGWRGARPTGHRTSHPPRPRSVPAATARRPRGRVQDHLPNGVTHADEAGHAGTRPPCTLESNCPFTPDSCAVACQLSRQQTPADGAPQGAETRALTCCRGRAARKHRAGLAPRCPRGGQAGEASGGDGSPGRKPICQGLHRVVCPTTELPHRVGKDSVRGSGLGGPAVLMSLHPVPPVGAAVVASVIARSYVA